MEIVFPAKKSVLLRDVWLMHSDSDPDQMMLTVDCIRCGKPPKVRLDKYSFLRSECDCDSIFTSSAHYTSALPGTTIEASLFHLNRPSCYLYVADMPPEAERSLKIWLSYQVGVPVDEIDIDITLN